MTDIVIHPEMGGEAGVSSLSADCEIVVSRLLDAPRALVWKAWTEAEHIARWWGGTGFEDWRHLSPLDARGRRRRLSLPGNLSRDRPQRAGRL